MSGAASESAFFPHVRDLPEGLSEDRFRSEYGDISSADYRQMIEKIDARIAEVTLYQ
jgi:hypothetical protein